MLGYLVLFSLTQAATVQEGANPIRKIVTLLQDMQKELEAEGEKEQDAFDKFMCYCNGNTDSMKQSVADGKQFSAEASSKLEALKSEKAQLDQELADHQSSRTAAKQDLETATGIRNKEADAFAAESTDMKTNLAAMTKAIAALEKGMGSFLQLGASQLALVQRVVESSTSADDFERQSVMDLLQGKQNQDYAPASGQITGILKAMKDEMSGDLKSAIDNEEQAKKGFAELTAAKQAEIQAATAAIESKTKRSGELAVEVVQTADSIEDADREVKETEQFLADLGGQCAAKKAQWAERQTMRAEEVAAIGEAIAILNDDDALDIFKKTASLAQESQGMGFLQKSAASSRGLRAHSIMVSLAQKSSSHQSQLALVASMMKSKAVDFSKINTMIDDMVTLLGKEQDDDAAQKEFCDGELATSAQDKADTEDKLANLGASISDMSATIESLTEEIATLENEIKALDKAVAEATAQRESEHAAFLTAQTENQAAQQLLEKARNRLYKVYRPGQYKEAPKRELTDEERILAASGRSDMIATEAPQMIAGTTQTAFAQVRVADSGAPPPPPETFGAYQKKDQKSNGVIALMDMMLNDLKKDHTEAEHEEEVAQKDYERLMASSQKTREQNANSITEQESAKAEWAEKLETAKTDEASTKQALLKIGELIQGLHQKCDFLLENFDARKEARTNEVEGLKNAKAVLAGANFS